MILGKVLSLQQQVVARCCWVLLSPGLRAADRQPSVSPGYLSWSWRGRGPQQRCTVHLPCGAGREFLFLSLCRISLWSTQGCTCTRSHRRSPSRFKAPVRKGSAGPTGIFNVDTVIAATAVQTGPSPGSPAGRAHPDPGQHHAGAVALHQTQQVAGQS